MKITQGLFGGGSGNGINTDEGNEIAISAPQEKNGYRFSHWKETLTGVLPTGEITSQTNPYIFTMNKNPYNIIAVYNQLFKLTVTNGTIDNTFNTEGKYIAGESVSVKADPDNAYAAWEHRFKNWSTSRFIENLDLNSKNLSFKMPSSDLNLTANYEYWYKYDIKDGSVVSSNQTADNFYKPGTEITIRAVNKENEHKEFVNWTYSPSYPALSGFNSQLSSTTFITNSDSYTIEAIYKLLATTRYNKTVIEAKSGGNWPIDNWPKGYFPGADGAEYVSATYEIPSNIKPVIIKYTGYCRDNSESLSASVTAYLDFRINGAWKQVAVSGTAHSNEPDKIAIHIDGICTIEDLINTGVISKDSRIEAVRVRNTGGQSARRDAACVFSEYLEYPV